MLIPRENALFLPGPMPVLLMSGAPVHELLPVVHAPDGNVPICEGWHIVAKLTFCVVDGPGESGCVIAGATTAEEAQETAAWCDAVEQVHGAVVLSLPELPRSLDWERLLTDGRSRGGFMPSLA